FPQQRLYPNGSSSKRSGVILRTLKFPNLSCLNSCAELSEGKLFFFGEIFHSCFFTSCCCFLEIAIGLGALAEPVFLAAIHGVLARNSK
ncbi:MAG: hypothetical protein K2X81_15030, partial [Candidatus Obscuribacterales bacterium]|nr:hypothetical protein [Candidatus Obscuribacterales bacterium]